MSRKFGAAQNRITDCGVSGERRWPTRVRALVQMRFSTSSNASIKPLLPPPAAISAPHSLPCLPLSPLQLSPQNIEERRRFHADQLDRVDRPPAMQFVTYEQLYRLLAIDGQVGLVRDSFDA